MWFKLSRAKHPHAHELALLPQVHRFRGKVCDGLVCHQRLRGALHSSEILTITGGRRRLCKVGRPMESNYTVLTHQLAVGSLGQVMSTDRALNLVPVTSFDSEFRSDQLSLGANHTSHSNQTSGFHLTSHPKFLLSSSVSSCLRLLKNLRAFSLCSSCRGASSLFFSVGFASKKKVHAPRITRVFTVNIAP